MCNYITEVINKFSKGTFNDRGFLPFFCPAQEALCPIQIAKCSCLSTYPRRAVGYPLLSLTR